jgi:hypothetical protein
MKLVRSDQVALGPADTVFRDSSRIPLVVAVLLIAVAGAMFEWANRGGIPWALAAMSGGLVLLMSLGFATQARRARTPDNWLLAADGRRILIKLRSHMQDRLPAGQADTIEVPLGEVESVRVARIVTLAVRADTTMRSTFLDVRLSPGIELAPVEQCLHAILDPPTEKGFSFRWLDDRVTVVDGRTLRLTWRSSSSRIAPSIERAIATFGQRTRVLPPIDQTIDFSKVGKGLDREAALEQLRALARGGSTVTAMSIGQRTFGWSAGEAKRFVDEVRRGGPPPKPRDDPRS